MHCALSRAEAAVVSAVLNFIDTDTSAGSTRPNAPKAFSIPWLSGAAWYKLEVDGEVNGNLLGRKIYALGLQTALKHVGRSGFSVARKALVTHVLSSDEVMFSLLRSSTRINPRLRDHPLDPDQMSEHVHNFWAILGTAFACFADEDRSITEWFAGWVYPVLEVAVRQVSLFEIPPRSGTQRLLAAPTGKPKPNPLLLRLIEVCYAALLEEYDAPSSGSLSEYTV